MTQASLNRLWLGMQAPAKVGSSSGAAVGTQISMKVIPVSYFYSPPLSPPLKGIGFLLLIFGREERLCEEARDHLWSSLAECKFVI